MCMQIMERTIISDVCIPRISRASSQLSGLLFRTGNPSNRNEYFMDFVSYSDGDSNYIAGDGFVESYSRLLPSETLHMMCSTTAMG